MKLDRWAIGIIVGFVLVVLVNAFVIYLAVQSSEPVVPSYAAEKR